MADPVFGNEKAGSIRDIPIPGKEEPKKTLNLKRENDNEPNLKDWDSMKGKNKRKGLKVVLGLR